MTVHEFVARYRASDDLEVILHNSDREYDDDVQTTAFAIQEDDPSNGLTYEISNAWVDTWNFEGKTLWIDYVER